MDDYDAFLYSIDDTDLFEGDGESDNDILDNIDEDHTDPYVVLVPASPPTSAATTRQGKSGDEKQLDRTSPKSVPMMMLSCHRVLTETFGFSGYKGKQKEVIEAAVSGTDVFVLAPTGMGKSLCFQIPAIAEDRGISIVVSPLLALMTNQVTNLRSKGIRAVSLTSETRKGEKSEILTDLLSKKPKNCLFYTTPEKLCTQDLMRTLAIVYSNGRLSRLVIDEAHCISEWGHDFRAEYRKLGSFRERFPGVPIMALTATATKNVQRDIVGSLKMTEDNLFIAVHPFNRTNLYYEVRYKSAPDSLSLMRDILEFIETLHLRRNRPSSGIIYCRKRGMCDELSSYLRGKGLNARPYHRGISSKALSKTLKEWEMGGAGGGGVDVVCATIAFGMGIDKSDVRYIIHYDLPKSMEGYYQETGRAGRDGLPARCILYYSREDALRLQRLVSSAHARRQDAASSRDGPEPSQRSVDSLGALISFAENVATCRHVSICRYFGEIIDTTNGDVMETVCDKMCDVCKYPDKTRQRITNLSDEEYAAAALSKLAWNAGYEEDEEYEGQKPQQQLQPQRAPASAGANGNGLNPGQQTLWDCLNSAPVQGFKRPNAHGRDKLVLPHSKRAKVEHTTEERNVTRTSSAKASANATESMPPPLVTRPHSSVNSLRKPFKTPFKTPFKVPSKSETHHVPKANGLDQKSERGMPSPPVDNKPVPNRKPKEDEDEVEIIEVQIKQESGGGAIKEQMDMDVEIPGVKIEVETSFSRKIPLETRTNAFDTLRKSLHRVFPIDTASSDSTVWSILTGAPTSTEGRTLVLAETAKKLEHAAHIMSATPSGYGVRIVQKRGAIGTLVANEGMARVKTGEKRAAQEEDEDVSEVMDALTEGVAWWHKSQWSQPK